MNDTLTYEQNMRGKQGFGAKELNVQDYFELPWGMSYKRYSQIYI